MEEFSTALSNLFDESPLLTILLIILAITLAFRFILWLYDKLMADRGFIGDVMNIIVWLIRTIIKVLIVIIIASVIIAAVL